MKMHNIKRSRFSVLFVLMLSHIRLESAFMRYTCRKNYTLRISQGNQNKNRRTALRIKPFLLMISLVTALVIFPQPALALTNIQADQLASEAFKGDASALQRLQRAAQTREAIPEYWLGAYFEGKKQSRDAEHWWRMAANQGFAAAEYGLGSLYDLGDGVAQDHSMAVRWWRKAAIQEFFPAERNLANAYGGGYGVQQDYVKAVQWWRKAADHRDGVAEYNLAYCYTQGHGVTRNYIAAVKWYILAKADELPGSVIYKKSEQNLRFTEFRMTPEAAQQGHVQAEQILQRRNGK